MHWTPEQLGSLIAAGINRAMAEHAKNASPSLRPEQLAELVSAGIQKATAGLVATVKSQQTENEALRRRLDALEAEVRAVQAKQSGGLLTLATRR